MRILVLATCLAALLPIAGAQFTNETAASLINVASNFGPRGAAWADFTGDGKLDLFAPEGFNAPVHLWVNNGNGTFTSQTAVASLGFVQARGVTAADIDNDGDQDAFVCVAGTGANRLYINDGTGTFTEEAASRGVGLPGIDSHHATWGDYDRDGWLDLYVAPHNTPTFTGSPDHVLFRNLGGGFFADVTAAAGAAFPANGFAVMWHDFDGDQWPDIACANDLGTSGAPPTQILMNNGDGTFTDIAAGINANAPIDGMGTTIADFDNDGDWDMFQTNLGTPGHVFFVWNAGNGAFDFLGNWQQVAVNHGLLPPYALGWACEFADYDNDGFEDLFVMHAGTDNALFRNNAGASFTNVTAAQNIPACSPGTYSATWVDYDDDGDLDLYDAGWITAAQLGANPGSASNWIKIALVGTNSNRDGIGALVIAKTASGTQRRYVHSGEGYLSDGDKRAHFGLGTDGQVDELEIRWPSGTVQYLSNLAANQIVTVTESRFDEGASPMTPGSVNTINLDLPADIGLLYIAGVTIAPGAEYPLGDGRAIRVNVNDPVLNSSIAPGNPYLSGFTGLMPVGGANVTLALPNFPITGVEFWMIGATISGSYVGNVKSIVGPQKFTVQ